jgi:diaminopimelate epimerase
MVNINFTKLVASGNDFILVDLRNKYLRSDFRKIAIKICNRRFGIGADGLLVLEKSKRAIARMRIFNSDGSEAEMCGNGARCVVYFLANTTPRAKGEIKIETRAGILSAQTGKEEVKINMTQPKNIKLGLTVKLRSHSLKLNFINTGVPHTVILCEGLERIDVFSLGKLIRFHKRFKPAGTNVNFIEPVQLDKIKIRTYERGVEEETLACGTGSVAAAIIYVLKLMAAGLLKKDGEFVTNVITASGETLKIYLKINKNKIKDVWLQGRARVICKGEFYV